MMAQREVNFEEVSTQERCVGRLCPNKAVIVANCDGTKVYCCANEKCKSLAAELARIWYAYYAEPSRTGS